LVEPARRAAHIVARSDGASFYLRPNFSPDGSLLVAERRDLESRRSSLWVLSANAPPRALVDDPQWNDTKAWFTRDGTRVVFGRRPAAGGASNLMSIAPDGSDLSRIVSSAADEHSPRPSPTRDEIVFVSNRDGLPNVFVVDLDGGSIRNLQRNPERRMFAPRWSPDGERIVTTVIPVDISGLDADGGEVPERANIVVLDRNGETLLDIPGAMADWMPPWP
jgi:Tol biopolymer transport system component